MQTYKDALSVDILEYGFPDYGDEASAYGVRFTYVQLEFDFAFPPKHEFQRVTGFSLTLVFARHHDRDFNFTITVNGVSRPSIIMRGIYPAVGISTTKLVDEAVRQAIVQGMNRLTLTHPMEWVWELNTWQSTQLRIYQIQICIEYEYVS